jgi:hypothetical protein
MSTRSARDQRPLRRQPPSELRSTSVGSTRVGSDRRIADKSHFVATERFTLAKRCITEVRSGSEVH